MRRRPAHARSSSTNTHGVPEKEPDDCAHDCWHLTYEYVLQCEQGGDSHDDNQSNTLHRIRTERVIFWQAENKIKPRHRDHPDCGNCRQLRDPKLRDPFSNFWLPFLQVHHHTWVRYVVSIHAPARGATCGAMRRSTLTTGFDPRPCARGD